MRNFEIIKSLVGDTVTEEDLHYVDCYVQRHLGIFIPFGEGCGYAKRLQHTHPAYMIVIYFGESRDKQESNKYIEDREWDKRKAVSANIVPVSCYDRYSAFIYSPEVPHVDETPDHPYYCILIDKEYFEKEYRKYADLVPHFCGTKFLICHDILKTLNLFAFEYSKQMANSDITLEAQATIITHWLIRSVLGESCDMRAISDHYAVARAQHFIEQHYEEEITVKRLAKLGNISVSSFTRIFKKELHVTPIEYLIEIRLQQAKKLLRRKEIPITQVALRCGFNSSSHLAASFQRELHMTPSAYRKLYCE